MMRGCLSGKWWRGDAVNGKAGRGTLGVVVVHVGCYFGLIGELVRGGHCPCDYVSILTRTRANFFT